MKHSEPGSAEGVLPFDPQWFQSDYRVTRWEPRQVVRFDKPLSLVETGVASFLFLFSGVWAWAGTVLLKGGLQPTSKVPHPIAVLVVFMILVLLPAALGLVALMGALPRHVRLDWPTGTITTGWLWKTETTFSQIVGLEVNHIHSSSSSSRGPARVTNYVWCELRAKIRAEAGRSEGRLLIVETDHRKGDPAGPYRQMIPLATDLAAALGVTQEVVSTYR